MESIFTKYMREEMVMFMMDGDGIDVGGGRALVEIDI
jgi:hypothetical protein